MKTRPVSVIVGILALVFMGATGARAQHGHHGATTQPPSAPMDMGKMMQEPHHVLATAYVQNLATFAKALHEQTALGGPVNVEFARAAVAEMRRSFDQIQQHHQGHMATMSAEMLAKMSGMMQQMETHQTELNAQITALENEVQAVTPDAKKVSMLAANVQAHLDAMTKMHEGSKGKPMKMKMKM